MNSPDMRMMPGDRDCGLLPWDLPENVYAERLTSVVYLEQRPDVEHYQQQYTPRSREQVSRFFAGTDMVEPGLVWVEEWRPEPSTDNTRKSLL